MHTFSSTAVLRLVALLCLAVACDDSPTTTEPPPNSEPSTWSEWRNLPPSFTTYAMWASNPNNVFAVGPAGTAARWNGTRWSTVTVGYVRDFWSVTGIAGGSIVAVGDGGMTLRFNGAAFEQTPVVTAENLRSVWAASPDTMLVVGENGAFLIGDGSTWSVQPPPTLRTLLSIWGTSTRDVFAVGPGGIIAHFDGASWSEQPSGTTETLASVSGASHDDVFAVGTSGTILHYDGANWSPMTSGTRDVLQCVVASPGNPMVVGANGTALEYAAGSWSRVDLGTTNWLYGACRVGSNTWVGGSRVIRAHDGLAWKSEVPGAVPVLRGVCTDVDGSVIAVGDNGYIARGRGEAWSVDESVDARTLYCAYRTRTGELFAGGLQRLLRFDDGQWVVESSDVVTWYGFGESPTQLYAVGSGGTLKRRAGASWVNENKPAFNESLNAVVCRSNSEGYAVGDAGVVLRYDGVAWNIMPSFATVDIRDVIEYPGDDPDRRALAVGENGALFLLNTHSVAALSSPTSANLYALARVPGGDILAFGGGAAMLRFRDATWKAENSPVLQPLYGACADGDEVFAVGGGIAGGLVLRFGPP